MRILRRFVAVLAALALLVTALPTVAAEGESGAPAWEKAGEQAALRMSKLSLVKGTPVPGGGVDLNLDGKITRAQLVVLLVRALGRAAAAQELKGKATFADASSHWASGEIAMAAKIAEEGGFALGLPDGGFHPDDNVNAASVVAFLAKFLKVAPTDAAWPANYIDGARQAGLLGDDLAALVTEHAGDAATRRMVFLLMDYALYNYKLADGRTVYTTFVKTDPPVVTVTGYPAETGARFITLSGTVKGQELLKVQGRPVETKADGSFQAVALLQAGTNTVAIEAWDIAGNRGTPATPVQIVRKPSTVPVLAFVQDSTIYGASLDDLTHPYNISGAGSGARVGTFAQYSQPVVSADGDWVYYVRTGNLEGWLTNAIMRAPAAPGIGGEVVVSFAGDKPVNDLALAPGGGVMFEQGGHLYRVRSNAVESLATSGEIHRASAGTGNWLLANLLSTELFMKMTVPVAKVEAVCSPSDAKVLSTGTGRLVQQDPVALPDGSGFVYTEVLDSRLAVQTWDGQKHELEVPGLSADRMDASPTVGNDGSLAFESTVYEETGIVVVKDLQSLTVLGQIKGNSPSLGGGPAVKQSAGPCGGSQLSWQAADLGVTVQTSIDK